jgi:putative membrane protein
MKILASFFTLFVAIEHIYIMFLEMFFSTSKVAQKTFNMTEEFLQNSRVKTLFANQGLYNGFLAAGLLFGLYFSPAPSNTMIQLFFLICVIIAALFGAITANIGILYKQGLPAILAVVFILFTY